MIAMFDTALLDLFHLTSGGFPVPYILNSDLLSDVSPVFSGVLLGSVSEYIAFCFKLHHPAGCHMVWWAERVGFCSLGLYTLWRGYVMARHICH